MIQHRNNKKNNIKMFVYVLNNEYLITWGKIPFIPNLKDNLKIQLIEEDEDCPITEETFDLYRHWIKYYVYRRIISYCSQNKGVYDYRVDNEYSVSLDTPKNKLNVGIRRVFDVNTEVLFKGTAYLSVDIKCKYESKSNIYDLIRQNMNVIGMQVKCLWASFDRTYTITAVLNTPIKENIKSLNLMEYWTNQAPWRLNNIDTNAPAVTVYDKSKKRDSYYIPQSLCPVVTREYIALNDKSLSKKVDEYTKLSMGKRLGII